MKPIYKLFRRYCKEKAEERHVHLSQVMIEMDIFAVCWPAIVNIYDKISKMIIIEESEWSAKNLPEFHADDLEFEKNALGSALLFDAAFGSQSWQKRS